MDEIPDEFMSLTEELQITEHRNIEYDYLYKQLMKYPQIPTSDLSLDILTMFEIFSPDEED